MPSPARPPGPRGLPLVGSMAGFVRDPAGFLLQLARRYGDIAHYTLGTYHVYLLNHPDFVRDVLVTHSRQFHKGPGGDSFKPMLGAGLFTSEDAFHLRQRRLSQPAFHRQRIAAYGEVMVRHAEDLDRRWTAGATVDMFEQMAALALGIASETLFASQVTDETRQIQRDLTTFMEWWRLFLLPAPDLLRRLPLPVNRRYARDHAHMNRTVARLIREHRDGQGTSGDLLALLIQAQDAEGDGGGMTDAQLHDEVITLLIAGHETVATALAWTWYLLALHPDVERQFHAELDTVLAGPAPTVADLPQLRYTEQIFAETLRLYPPGWGMDRRVLSDYEVGGYVVPAGSVVALSPYVMHHDPRYYPDPDRFDPGRWTAEEQAKRPKYAYFPFGGGNRLCIGEHYAWMEGILALATLGRHWTPRLKPGRRVAAEALATLRPRGGMPMQLMQRNS